MKKIVCLIEDLSSGGAERQLVYLASELKRKGNDVQVWTYYPDTFYLPLLNQADVEYKYIPEAKDRKKRILVLRKKLKDYNPDTVIAYLDTACMVACIIKALGAEFKLIVSERNTTQYLSRRERIKFFLYRFADYIVPNSNTQSDYIINTYPKLKPKVKTITNYIDTQKFIPLSSDDCLEGLKIIVAGRIMPQKNPITLMQAIRTLKDEGFLIEVTWYGNSYDKSFTDECLATIRQLGISDIFKFMPSNDNIANIYPQYNAFCLPSLYEGFSNVLCEAMSCGLPILCSRVADNPYIAYENENAFFFDPKDVPSIVKAIKKMASLSKEERRNMGKKSRSLSLSQFSKEKFILQYENLINE